MDTGSAILISCLCIMSVLFTAGHVIRRVYPDFPGLTPDRRRSSPEVETPTLYESDLEGRRVFKSWEQNSWGNNVEFLKYPHTVYGHVPSHPNAGDVLKVRMESGRVAVFEFTDVEPQQDPPDMFFADVKPLGYKGDEDFYNPI